MTHPLRCTCGTLTGCVENERHANHGACYCTDCQAFARFLGREADILNERGGCEVVQTLPKDVVFQTGAEHLACVCMTEKGPLRWYAACCNTPIGATAQTSKLPFVGLSRLCLESPAPTVEQSFGAVRTLRYISGARGQPRPRPFGGARFMVWLIRNRLRARSTGGFRLNPFFDTAADKPIVEPKQLTAAERAQLG
jgi:hypothetical protein